MKLKKKKKKNGLSIAWTKLLLQLKRWENSQTMAALPCKCSWLRLRKGYPLDFTSSVYL